MSDRKPIVSAIKILIIVGVMAGAVWSVGEHLRNKAHDDTSQHAIIDQGSPLDHIKAQAEDLPHARLSTPAQMPTIDDIAVRNLKTYYARRAYHGAPPAIPHEVEPDRMRDQNCNVCHERGGFAPTFNAFTPVTPHPEFSNCMQCHVPETTEALFVESTWESVRPPRLQRAALPGSPPPIPHTLQLRDNCIVCHAGPAAPLEIRTTHPERLNCRQCHVPESVDSVFERPEVME